MASIALLRNEDLTEVRLERLAAGEVAYFTTRSPHSESKNEDCLLVYETAQGLVLAVADGAGGTSAGDRASRTTIETLETKLSAIADTRVAILDAFEEANRQVLAFGTGAATTLLVVEITVSDGHVELRPYHSGDSSLLCFGNRGKLKLSTISHSPVGYAVEAGLIDADAALHHDDLNLVSNVIGMADLRIEMGSPLRLAELDRVVLGSDGLFDNLQQSEIIELVRKGKLTTAACGLREQTARRMSGKSEGPSKPDDLSFLIFRPHSQTRSSK